MAIKSSNITQIDQDVTNLKSTLGDTDSLGDMSTDGTVVGAIRNLEVKALGGTKITQADYDTLEDKSGIYYIIDGNSTNESFEDLVEIVGDTDISGVADGTITGAIAEFAANGTGSGSSASSAEVTEIKNTLGDTDISSIGNGTVTGAIAELAARDAGTVQMITQAEYDALEDKSGFYCITDVESDAEELLDDVDTLKTTVGTTDISTIADGTITGILAQFAANGTGGSTEGSGIVEVTQEEYDALEDTTGAYFITDAPDETSSLTATVNSHTVLLGDTDISGIADGSVTGAIIELESIVKGATGSKVFDTFADMETWLKDSANAGTISVGNHIYIKETDVSDYWISNVLGSADETTGYYYEISELETAKVDMSEYDDAIDEIKTSLNNYALAPTEITGTLSAGSTSITLTSDEITTDSFIEIFTNVYSVSPIDVETTTGSIVLTFEEQTSDVKVKVRVS